MACCSDSGCGGTEVTEIEAGRDAAGDDSFTGARSIWDREGIHGAEEAVSQDDLGITILDHLQSAASSVRASVPAISLGHVGLDGCCDTRSATAMACECTESYPTLQQEMLACPPRQTSSNLISALGGALGVKEDVKDAPLGDGVQAENKDKFWGYGKRMDDAAMLEKLWWCCWCCCAGCGYCQNRAPLSLALNCCCFNYICQTNPMKEPDGALCGFVNECVGCIWIGRWPPKQGNPRCICCSKDFCGMVGTLPMDRDVRQNENVRSKGRPLAAFTKHLHEPLIFCFACCAGLRVAVPMDLVDAYCKCLCCEHFFNTGLPSVEAGFCHYLLNCWCYYSLCKCPPSIHHNPIIGCCGYRVGGHDFHQTR